MGCVRRPAGRTAEYIHVRKARDRLSSKTTLELGPGDVISVRTCGGGGYGRPEERDPERCSATCSRAR